MPGETNVRIMPTRHVGRIIILAPKNIQIIFKSSLFPTVIYFLDQLKRFGQPCARTIAHLLSQRWNYGLSSKKSMAVFR